MSQGETPITIVGNLVADLELRFTQSGTPVANGRVASTPRKFDSQSNQWVDGEALFLSLNIWRGQAEQAANSLQKGMRVIVSGTLKQRSYETREGEKRTVFEVEVDDIGPSLKYATAQVQKAQGNGQGGGGYQGGGQGGGGYQGGQGSQGGGGYQGGGQGGYQGGNQQPQGGGGYQGGQGGYQGGGQGGGNQQPQGGGGYQGGGQQYGGMPPGDADPWGGM